KYTDAHRQRETQEGVPLEKETESLNTPAATYRAAAHTAHSPEDFAGAISAPVIDIIGDSLYLLCVNLCDLTRQTARVPSCDRTHARRVCACAAGLCCGLCRTLSATQDLGRQGAPPPERRRCQRRFVPDGRQAALHPRLPEDQSAANHARLAS